jgi:hypothetical protein
MTMTFVPEVSEYSGPDCLNDILSATCSAVALRPNYSSARMALFEDESKDTHHFPTLPAFVCPVAIRETPQYGSGHKGIFAQAKIPKGTKFWVWTDRVNIIPHQQLEEYMEKEFGNDVESIRVFLRQGFVLPPGAKGNEDQFFYSNPTDAGRFMNHSSYPNCGPDGALCDILEGEEMTMDYSFHGNPQWYEDVCHKYGVLTERQVAKQGSNI